MSKTTEIVLFARPEYWLLPEDERDGRCGPGRGILERLVPDSILGICVTPACSIHDYDYKVGQTIEDKKKADRAFRNNLIRIIEAFPDSLTEERCKLAQVYYEFVHHFGGPAFWKGKNNYAEESLVSISMA